MTSFPFAKMQLPSDDEMTRAEDIGHEVVAISSVNDEDRMFLKLLCRNGDETVVWLDAFLIDHLFRHFERALSGAEQVPGDPVRTKFLKSETGSLGTVPRDHRR